MDTLPEDPILTFPKDILKVIRKIYNLDKLGAMDAAIDILELWLRKQNHFVTKDFSREYLERCIIRSKGSVERAKERLDGMCTVKTLSPQLFIDYNIKESRPDFLLDAWLPNLTSDYYRVFLLENTAQTLSYDFFHKFYIRIIQFIEYTFAHDYCNGVIYIVDYRTTNLMELIKNLELNLLEKVFQLLLKSYGVRIKAIHIISESKVINLFINILKQVVSEKVKNRIYVHKELETLYEHVEKDILPKDYGGNEKSLKELNGMWMDLLSSEEYMEYMKKINAAKTNESLRMTDASNNQYLGIPGSFRSLTVD